MKRPAIVCDHDDCPGVVREEQAQSFGWLSIGGERRGRARVDLCPYHARLAIAQIKKSMPGKRK